MNAIQQTTINPAESAHFDGLAADWWNPDGQSAMLHTLNPVRLGFVRRAIDAHWGGDGRTLKPLADRSVLDAGCGAGLMCEPLARLGGSVTGVDAAPENVTVACEHAAAQGLSITYRAIDVIDLEGQFDLVTSMEVIEHVSDPAAFVSALAARLAPGGLMILSTPNRTPLSRLAMIHIGEGLGRIPKGTHHWDQFLTPDELSGLCADAGLQIIDRSGLAWNPAKQFHLSADEQLNYLFALVRCA